MLEIAGRVSSIAWRDDYTGETHARLVPETKGSGRSQDSVYPFSGHFAFPLVVGECVRLGGEWGERKGERVFRVRSVTRIPPSTREGEVIALSSYIPGLSKAGAAELLEAAGGLAALKEVCTRRPEEIDTLFPGDRRRKVRMHLRQFQWDRNELDLELTGALQSIGNERAGITGVRTDQIQRMIRHFGAGPLRTILQTRPYDLVDVPKIGFATADKIAYYYSREQGRPFDALAPERLRHGVCEILGRERANGHVCLPEAELVRRVIVNLRSPEGERLPRGPETEGLVRKAISEALKLGQVVQEYEQIYTLGLHKAERDLALQIAKLVRAAPPTSATDLRRVRKYLVEEEARTGVALNAEQTSAVEMAISHPLCLVTGGPGVGKTLVSSRIVGALKALGRTFSIVAPTGKAAKRAADVTGEQASTIHRACQLDMQDDVHSRRYGKRLTRYDHLRVDSLLIDEGSMVDLPIGFEVLRRVRPGATRVIIIGDVDQLPPVGPGQVFRDLLSSGVIPFTRLTQVYRQEGGSPIVDCAYQINAGTPPEEKEAGYEVKILDPRTSRDFVPSDDESANNAREADIAIRWLLYSIRRYAADLALDAPHDIQIYAPERQGPVGIDRLNEILRDHFNPLPPGTDTRRNACVRIRGGYIVQPGCKVMQIQNDYRLRYVRGTPAEAYEEFHARAREQEKDRARRSRGRKMAKGTGTAPDDVVPVMNGQIGFVTRVDAVRGEIEVKFDDLEHAVLYRNSSEWQKLSPAWAMSIHKSQGSETPFAFIVLHSGMYMINRALLYTGWTRAKRGVLLIASAATTRRAVTNTQGAERYSNLAARLREHIRSSR